MTQPHRLPVVLLWHMHQPHYRDALTGEYVFPWTYLHAIKDYSDMAAHLESNPKARAVVNFTPVLLEQLAELAAAVTATLDGSGKIPDPLLATLGPAGLPSASAARLELLQACLRAQREQMIERFEPYRAHRRHRGELGDARAHRLCVGRTAVRSRGLVPLSVARGKFATRRCARRRVDGAGAGLPRQRSSRHSSALLVKRSPASFLATRNSRGSGAASCRYRRTRIPSCRCFTTSTARSTRRPPVSCRATPVIQAARSARRGTWTKRCEYSPIISAFVHAAAGLRKRRSVATRWRSSIAAGLLGRRRVRTCCARASGREHRPRTAMITARTTIELISDPARHFNAFFATTRCPT